MIRFGGAPDPSERSGMEAWLRDQLLVRRQVLLRGPLDDAATSDAAAALMYLDATGDGPVHLQIDSAGGPLLAALTLVDTIELLGVPVFATCLGRAEGAAVAVLAACTHRAAGRHARFRLHEAPSAMSGTGAELAAWSAQRTREWARYVAVVAGATGRPLEHVEADIAAGRWLDASEARAYGLIHEVLDRPATGGPTPSPGGAPFGFGPRR